MSNSRRLIKHTSFCQIQKLKNNMMIKAEIFKLSQSRKVSRFLVEFMIKYYKRKNKYKRKILNNFSTLIRN